ncbi:MAG: hypothetical protein ABI869_06355 [Actinomycetota bacterium]
MVESWDVAQDVPRLDVRDLMRREREHLIALLSSLSADDWRVRVLDSWDVRAVSLHLFRNDFERVRNGWSGQREGSGLDMDYASLAEEIERGNDEWIVASRDIPPALMPDLLRVSGKGLDASLADADLAAPGVPVAWTGSGLSPVWLDIAREYTERWVHHQQIRDALYRSGLKGTEWMHPVLQTFMLALPRAYDHVRVAVGTTVAVVAVGPAGGAWYLRRDEARWRLVERGESPSAEVRIPEDVAWRLYVRLISPAEAMSQIERSGPHELGEPACRAVAIMTSVA